jgi:hypothetical protein
VRAAGRRHLPRPRQRSERAAAAIWRPEHCCSPSYLPIPWRPHPKFSPLRNGKRTGADIRHVEHALGKLDPGSRLVAIVANGPRQRERLEPIAMEWIDLPAGSFAGQGTSVNAAMVVLDAEQREAAVTSE